MSKTREGYLLRAKRIQEIDRQHYEPYHDSCHKMVWRKYVYPVYGCSYGTFLKYLRFTGEPPKDKRQLDLFEASL